MNEGEEIFEDHLSQPSSENEDFKDHSDSEEVHVSAKPCHVFISLQGFRPHQRRLTDTKRKITINM